MKELGKALKLIRVSYGLTQYEVASAVSLTRPQIANLELGNSNPSIGGLIAYAAAFGMKVSDIILMAEQIGDQPGPKAFKESK